MANAKTTPIRQQQDPWAEKLVWRWLRNRRFNRYKFRRQHPIGDYYLDSYCHEAALSIELDGFHHGFPEQQLHDLERTRYLSTLGIKELRFWNYHLRTNERSIRDTIFRELQIRAPHQHASPDLELKPRQKKTKEETQTSER